MPEAKNALIRMLDDDILEIRLAAAEQLGVFKDPIGEVKVLEVFEKNLPAVWIPRPENVSMY